MNPDPPPTAYSSPKPPPHAGEPDPVVPLGPAAPPEVPGSTPANPVFWNWWDVFIALGLVLPSLIVAALLITVPLTIARGGVPPSGVSVALWAQLLGYIFWIICLWALFRLRHGRPLWASLAFGRSPDPLRYLALGPALALAVGGLAQLLHAKEIDMPMMDEIMADPVQRVLFIIFGATFGPLCEELFFRGLVLPPAVRTFGIPIALVITSVPFALLHGPQYSWSWQHLLLLVIAGAVFGYIRVFTGSTTAATLTHCAYNLTMFGGFFLNGRNH